MIEGQEGVTWPQWLAIASACERHAIETLFTSDHYMRLGTPVAGEGGFDAWSVICALGAVTERLRFGTLVSPVTFRHPSVLAKVVVTADHITGGRVELGLGSAWNADEHRAFGLPFPELGRRMELLEQQLQVIRGCWGEEAFSLLGPDYTISDLDALPKPVQAPHPRLIVGGQARARSAALAARFADEYNTGSADSNELRERRDRIAAACAARGRDPIPLSVAVTVVFGRDQRDLRERAAAVAAQLGTTAERLLGGGESETLCGTVDQVAATLREWRELGVSRVMCRNLLIDDEDYVAILGGELRARLG